MRLVHSTWCLGFALAVIACNDANGVPPNGGCSVGHVYCNNLCYKAASCAEALGSGGASTTTAATGGSVTVGNGGQTQTTGVGTGGKTSTSSGGAVATGGKPATGGAPATGGSTYVDNPSVCDDTAKINSTMSGQYSRLYINTTNNPSKNYVGITNWWHKFTNQVVAVNGIGFKVTNSDSSPDDAPVGFPTIFIGTYQNNASAGSNLPKQLSAITSVPTVFDTNATSLDTSNFNATYDVWLTANNTPLSSTSVNSPGTGGAYVMVWLYKPSNRQPRGSVKASGQTIGTVSNTWDVWVDSTNPPCISYVAKTPISALTFDLKQFLTDSTKYGVTNSMYLSIVFAGFEIWGGGNGATINKFCAKVN